MSPHSLPQGPGVVHPGGPCGSCQQLKTHPWEKERCERGLLVALAHESLPFILHLPVPAILASSPAAGSTVGKWTCGICAREPGIGVRAVPLPVPCQAPAGTRKQLRRAQRWRRAQQI